MKFKQAMIAWNRGGEIKVVAWPDKAGAARHLRMTCGACYFRTQDFSPEEVTSQVFIDFNTIVVRDGISPADAHKAFLAIDEYRASLADDIPGGDPTSV